jgi:rhodanese-related sulfurtransferase
MSAFKKQFSENFASLVLPAALDHITPEAVHTAITEAEAHIIIDVRGAEEFKKGSIVGSRNVDLDSWSGVECGKFVEEIAALHKAGTKAKVTFVSLQSPDIDSAAALEFTHLWDELAEVKDQTFPPSHDIVHILLGGVFHWFQLYKEDGKVTANYSAATWDKLLPRAETPETGVKAE